MVVFAPAKGVKEIVASARAALLRRVLRAARVYRQMTVVVAAYFTFLAAVHIAGRRALPEGSEPMEIWIVPPVEEWTRKAKPAAVCVAL